MGMLVFSDQSRDDILSIWAQIATHDRRVADAFFDKIEARCGQLADFPELGPRRHDIAAGARVLVVDRWIVVYRIVDGGVLIVRVLDGARDLSGLIAPDD